MSPADSSIQLQGKNGPYLLTTELTSYRGVVSVDIRRRYKSTGWIGETQPYTRAKAGILVPAAGLQWLISSLIDAREHLIGDGFLEVTDRPEVVRMNASVYGDARSRW